MRDDAFWLREISGGFQYFTTAVTEIRRKIMKKVFLGVSEPPGVLTPNSMLLP